MSRGRAAWLIPLVLLAGTASALAPARAQPRLPGADTDDAAYVESLRRQEPALAARYVALRDARQAAVAALRTAQERYSAGGPALRSVSLPELKQARRRYAEASLALLDFLDARDREAIGRLEANLERVKRALEERSGARAEMEQMLRSEQ